MILADIGNTRVHIYQNGKVIHLSHREAINLYGDKRVYYITVKRELEKTLKSLKNWIDISNKITLKGAYETMGVDRKALCLSYSTGLFISAGTAITVDIVEDSIYKGGFLLLGLKEHLRGYANISPALKSDLNRDIDLDKLPKSTRDGISYSIISSIKMVIEKHQNNKQIYISGGDGKFISSLLKNAIFDETLIFKGMKKAIRVNFYVNIL